MPYLVNTLVFILLGLNGLGFLLVALDKSKARRHRWRIPEKTFFAVAVLGGSLGTYGGCLFFRHKTKHPQFMMGLPLLIGIQTGLGLWWCLRR